MVGHWLQRRTLHCVIPALMICSVSLAGSLGAQGDALGFYATAQATIDAPPSADSLRVVCSREVGANDTHIGAKGWFSLLAPPGDSVGWIAAFTRRRISRVSDVLVTSPRWSPMPTAKPRASGTLDWAWIWDRNGDGRADYVAYLQNAHAVLPDPVPDTFPVPTRNADGSYSATTPLLYAMIEHTAMVFRHYADDDFDGRVDVAVVEEFDPIRPMFVRGWVVARASRRDGIVDEAWAFRRDITDTTRVLLREADGSYRLPSISAADGSGSESALARLAHGTAVLSTVNTVNARCARGPLVIRRP